MSLAGYIEDPPPGVGSMAVACVRASVDGGAGRVLLLHLLRPPLPPRVVLSNLYTRGVAQLRVAVLGNLAQSKVIRVPVDWLPSTTPGRWAGWLALAFHAGPGPGALSPIFDVGGAAPPACLGAGGGHERHCVQSGE